MNKKIASLFIVVFFIFSLTVHAEDGASPLVPLSDAIYWNLEILKGHGLIPSSTEGTGPSTQREINRQVLEARSQFDQRRANPATYWKETADYLDALITKMEESYPDETLSLHALKSAEISLIQLDSPGRDIFRPNSSIDARYNPLTQYQSGRHIVDGTQIGLSSVSQAQITSHASFSFSPYIQLQLHANDQEEEQGFFVEELYGNVNFFNTQLDIGRRPFQWGQSDHGGVLFTDNARPLDGIFLSNPRPWKIPHMGFLKYSFLLATLGSEQSLNNTLISGLKLTYKPWSIFEFAIARALTFGGDGAPPASAATQFAEFFGARPDGGDNGNFSNSISGFEFRVTLPFLRFTQIYSEFYFDDFNLSHIPRSFVQDAGILGGIFIPRLDDKGTWSARIEGRKMAPIMYQHNVWKDGWAENGFILGDPLGPDAESLRLELKKSYPKMTFSGEFNYERVDSDIYSSDPSKGRVIATDGTPENRYRFQIRATRDWNKRLTSRASLGYERVTNPTFLSRGSQDNFLVSVGLKVNLDTKTTISKQ